MGALTSDFCFIVAILCALQHVAADDNNAFRILFERIDRLEASDVANKLEIASLKADIKTLTINSLETENILLGEINALKLRLSNQAGYTSKKTPLDIMVNGEQTSANHKSSEAGSNTTSYHVSKMERKSVKVRETVENEVAFYTTHSKHDVQHLGHDQIIVFDQAVTNVGNAYSSQRGEFVAPVDGTYVFHVTMMGKDVHAVTARHFNAYIDVSGKPYSQLWVEPYQQSSQMFVMNLTAGKVVSIKNNIQDDGFIGQHMSTFSGFLLYQNYYTSGIIGK